MDDDVQTMATKIDYVIAASNSKARIDVLKQAFNDIDTLPLAEDGVIADDAPYLKLVSACNNMAGIELPEEVNAYVIKCASTITKHAFKAYCNQIGGDAALGDALSSLAVVSSSNQGAKVIKSAAVMCRAAVGFFDRFKDLVSEMPNVGGALQDVSRARSYTRGAVGKANAMAKAVGVFNDFCDDLACKCEHLAFADQFKNMQQRISDSVMVVVGYDEKKLKEAADEIEPCSQGGQDGKPWYADLPDGAALKALQDLANDRLN
jgi:hypothetical protein